MSCDPSTLLASANCILDCLTKGQMDAINSSLLCGMVNSTGNFVLKTGDTMTGNLLMTFPNSFRSGLVASSDVTNLLAFDVNGMSSYFGSSGTNEILCRYSNDATGPSIVALKTRSLDTTADTIIISSDVFFFMDGIGSDGATYGRAARIQLRGDAAGVPGLNDMPGKIELDTSPDGTATLNVRWTIDNTGLFASQTNNVIIKSATPIPAGGTAGVGYMFSATANFGMFFGSGIPALSAAQGSWYSRSDGSGTTDRAYINIDGAVGWTAVTTVA